MFTDWLVVRSSFVFPAISGEVAAVCSLPNRLPLQTAAFPFKSSGSVLLIGKIPPAFKHKTLNLVVPSESKRGSLRDSLRDSFRGQLQTKEVIERFLRT